MGKWDHGHVRVQRAEEHLEDLKTTIVECLRVDAQSIIHHVDTERSEDVWEVLNHTDPPDWRISVLLGDTAHCLRVALNNLAYSITGQDCDFPIFLSSTHRAYAGKRDAFPGPARKVVDRFQPDQDPGRFVPERHPLWIVHRLDVIDKHMLVPWAPVDLHFDGVIKSKGFNDRNVVEYRTVRQPPGRPDLKPPTLRVMFSLEPFLKAKPLPWEALVDAHKYVRDELFPAFESFLS
jgi:hypothetical protein